MKYTKYAILITLIVTLISCSMLLEQTGPVPVEITADSFIITWRSEKANISDLPSSLKSFRLYYRRLGTEKWHFIRTTKKCKLKAFIAVSELNGYGSYEFGVQQIYNNEKVSEIHKSTDFNSIPIGGWYLILSPY